jgi:hypothetical protein
LNAVQRKNKHVGVAQEKNTELKKMVQNQTQQVERLKNVVAVLSMPVQRTQEFYNICTQLHTQPSDRLAAQRLITNWEQSVRLFPTLNPLEIIHTRPASFAAKAMRARPASYASFDANGSKRVKVQPMPDNSAVGAMVYGVDALSKVSTTEITPGAAERSATARDNAAGVSLMGNRQDSSPLGIMHHLPEDRSASQISQGSVGDVERSIFDLFELSDKSISAGSAGDNERSIFDAARFSCESVCQIAPLSEQTEPMWHIPDVAIQDDNAHEVGVGGVDLGLFEAPFLDAYDSNFSMSALGTGTGNSANSDEGPTRTPSLNE